MVPRRTPWLGPLVALVVALGLTVPLATSAEAASNGSWSVYPTTQPGSTPRVVFSPQLTPGHTSSDSVTVSNLSASPLTFELFAADAFNTPGGGLSLRRKVDPVEGIGAWIHLAHSSAVVAAHASAVIPFVVVVPPNATPGDHVGGIVAEETTGTPSSRGSVPVNVVQAVGVRVYGRVGGPLIRHLEVAKPQVDVDRTTAAAFGATTNGVVTVKVVNSGNVVLTPVVHLKITSSFGPSTTRTFSTGPLLPDETVARRFTVPVRTAGELQAQVNVAASGTHDSASSSEWNLPWGLFVVLLFVVVLLAALVVILLRRRSRERRAETADDGTAKGESEDDAAEGDGPSGEASDT